MRFDGTRGQLELAGRVLVKLAFAGVEPGETGTGSVGRLERRQPRVRQEVLAQLHTCGVGFSG